MKFSPIKAAVFGFVVGFVYMFSACGSDVKTLERHATEFAREAGWDVRTVKCQKFDSDDNGYVSCTVFTKDDGPIPIECPSDYSWNGCAGEGDCRPIFMNMTKKKVQ